MKNDCVFKACVGSNDCMNAYDTILLVWLVGFLQIYVVFEVTGGLYLETYTNMQGLNASHTSAIWYSCVHSA